MTQSPAGRQRLVKLGFLALLCALPFLVAIIYLERQVERIDTLPVDEYKDLTWAPDGRTLVLLHRPLADGAQSEVWSGDASSEFNLLGHLPADKTWRLTGQSVDDALVLAGTANGTEQLDLFEKGGPKFLDLQPEWSLLPSQGKGLFFSRVVDNLAFDQMVEVEDAPEVEQPVEQGAPPSPAASLEAPTRSGLQIARYNPQSGKPDVLLTIPFTSPKERPKVVLVRESLDKRFLAVVTQFGEAGAAGLWVYDSEASRLLWTRVITDSQVQGLDWSSSSVALALCDGQGVVLLDNVLNIESTRYAVQGLGQVKPLFAEENELYLLGETSLHRLERQAGQAEMVFDSHNKGLEAINFVVNPAVSRAAFFSSQKGYLELFVYDLEVKDSQPSMTSLPGSLRRAAQGTLTYQIGDALRTAWQFWKT